MSPCPPIPVLPELGLPGRIPVARLFRRHGLFGLVATCWATASLSPLASEELVSWSAGLLYIAYDTWLLGFVGWKTRHLSAEALPVTTNALPLAILVAARNEERVLAACIDTVLDQQGPDDEIWIVDDGSSDGTAALLHDRYAIPPEPAIGVSSSLRHPGLGVLRKPHSGKADSLNRAWPLVGPSVILTLDADTVLHPRALDAIRHAFARNPSLAAACGVLTPHCAPAPLGTVFEGFQRFEYLRAFLARAAWERLDALLLVSGAFAAYRVDVLARIGGYQPRSLVEDYELIHRLQRHRHDHGLDWQVRVIAAAQAHTDAPAGLQAFLRQRQRWFAGFLETQFANGDLVGNPRYGALGRWMLPIKSVDTLQPLFGLTAFVLLVDLLTDWRSATTAVLWVIGAKLLVDFGYHLWALDRYHRWIGQRPGAALWAGSVVATLAEPFCFQLIRHLGALRGWFNFLTGRVEWFPQRRPGAPS
ncbi:hypothetical protein B1810_05505 [Panacagrimonas perspica]|nr:hypothetical protein B1810_05505 [Panacagrimonas perspica]